MDHPNIVKLHEVYLDHKFIHLVTDLLEGGELDPESMQAKRYSEAQAADIICQSLQSLNYLHDLNIVHRDLKTENILFTKDKRIVKLIDFGFANFTKGDET